MLHLKIFSLNFVFFFRCTLINVLFLTLILKHLHIIWWAIIFQEGKHASIILKNMDHVNEILIQKANVTNVTTRFCGSNLGNHFSFDFSIIMLNLPKKLNKNRMVNFFLSRTDDSSDKTRWKRYTFSGIVVKQYFR